MHSYQKHYYDVVQKDLILSESLSSVSMLSAPKRVSLCIGGDSTDESYVIASLSALKIISGQMPYFTQQQLTKQKGSVSREGVGGKVTLRGSACLLYTSPSPRD